MPRRPATQSEVSKIGPKKVYSNRPKYPPPGDSQPAPNGTIFENDPNIIRKLKAGIERGLPPQQAAVLAGISWRTYVRYRSMARLGIEKYQPLEQAIQEAQSTFADTCIQKIMQAGLKGVGSKDPDWKALIRMLESLVPETFKPKVDVELSTERDFEARRLLDLVRQEVGSEVAERIVQRYLAESGPGVLGGSAGTEGGAGETAESSSG